MKNPRVSVVVPTYNRSKYLVKAIRSLLDQDINHGYEIVIIDDGSTDNTKEVVKKIANEKIKPNVRLKYYYQHNKGRAVARNLGISKSKGKYIAFTNSDCIPDKRWLGLLVSNFEDDFAGIGGKTVGVFPNLIGKYIDDSGIINPRIVEGEVIHLPTCNACYIKSVLNKVGRFDNKLFSGQDVELSYKVREIGYKLRFVLVL